MPKFTDRFLASLKVEPGKKDRIVFDTECPGLGLRITAKGTRGFIAQWTDPATKRKIREPLGVWGNITIDQARTGTRARLGEVAKGLDPAAERKRKKADADAERAEAALTLDSLISQWTTLHLSQRRPRYSTEAPRAIRFAFADFLKRPAARLSRADTIDVLDKLVSAGKVTIAGRTAAYGRACYTWARKRGKVPANPFESIPISAANTERDRVLSDDELAAIWAAAGSLGEPFGPFFKVAILTLQRREEVAGMRWSELSEDLSLWTIPGSRMKNGKPHDIHLPQIVGDILKTVTRLEKCDLVFSTTGMRPVSGLSKAKLRLDAKIAARNADERRGADIAPPVPWRLHDLRRTGVSKLAALGFDSIVADKLLAHKPAKLRGVASVYQRHDFAAERARALDAWAAHVSGTKGNNVVPITKRAAQ